MSSNSGEQIGEIEQPPEPTLVAASSNDDEEKTTTASSDHAAANDHEKPVDSVPLPDEAHDQKGAAANDHDQPLADKAETPHQQGGWRWKPKPKVYSVGDLVLVKVKGHPNWPAKVESVNNTGCEMQYNVIFFATQETARSKRKELILYDHSEKCLSLVHPKHNIVFNKAVFEIEKEYEQLKREKIEKAEKDKKDAASASQVTSGSGYAVVRPQIQGVAGSGDNAQGTGQTSVEASVETTLSKVTGDSASVSSSEKTTQSATEVDKEKQEASSPAENTNETVSETSNVQKLPLGDATARGNAPSTEESIRAMAEDVIERSQSLCAPPVAEEESFTARVIAHRKRASRMPHVSQLYPPGVVRPVPHHLFGNDKAMADWWWEEATRINAWIAQQIDNEISPPESADLRQWQSKECIALAQSELELKRALKKGEVDVVKGKEILDKILEDRHWYWESTLVRVPSFVLTIVQVCNMKAYPELQAAAETLLGEIQKIIEGDDDEWGYRKFEDRAKLLETFLSRAFCKRKPHDVYGFIIEKAEKAMGRRFTEFTANTLDDEPETEVAQPTRAELEEMFGPGARDLFDWSTEESGVEEVNENFSHEVENTT